jgi:hypothetical protein
LNISTGLGKGSKSSLWSNHPSNRWRADLRDVTVHPVLDLQL